METQQITCSTDSISTARAATDRTPFAKTLDGLRTNPELKLFWDCIWTPPATRDQFFEYAGQLRRFATYSGGLLGRSPDFLAGIVSAWATNATHFGENAQRVQEFHRGCRAANSILTHAISDISERGRISEHHLLRVVGRDSDGIYLSGFKQLATLAPYADVLLIYPYRMLSQTETSTALCVAVEPGSDGVKVHPRPGFRGAHEIPDESIDVLDEQDAIIELDHAFVPNANVFIDGSVEQCNTFRARTGMTHPAWVQALARMSAKAQLYHELAQRVLDGGPTSAKEPAVLLAKLRRFATSTERDFAAALESATFDERYGFWAADRTTLLQGIGNFTERIEGAATLLSQIAGLDLICPKPGRTSGQGLLPVAPQLSDWTLFTNLSSGAYGYRQNKYELAFVGDPDRLAAG
ncbi:4-hydroxyphenylacetate 3-hydroxylase N-terminal domain-containing protein [Nocardia brasiliensis]|uniref:4-hydroxyphenylacetate 3-hydroxylase N-terminal domain-containing protein n=1 Tax=Nocardia brasiliensis TaxID=37326 RepID=UPI00245782DB|nr:4-hydroxyphenylacetate 3-hydroxylase N-terminal domain-containing protein [Nocardia brasiliensis]